MRTTPPVCCASPHRCTQESARPMTLQGGGVSGRIERESERERARERERERASERERESERARETLLRRRSDRHVSHTTKNPQRKTRITKDPTRLATPPDLLSHPLPRSLSLSLFLSRSRTLSQKQRPGGAPVPPTTDPVQKTGVPRSKETAPP